MNVDCTKTAIGKSRLAWAAIIDGTSHPFGINRKSNDSQCLYGTEAASFSHPASSLAMFSNNKVTTTDRRFASRVNDFYDIATYRKMEALKCGGTALIFFWQFPSLCPGCSPFRGIFLSSEPHHYRINSVDDRELRNSLRASYEAVVFVIRRKAKIPQASLTV
ncbi:hypothetical protein GGD46_006025 [Rhizobium lusitanum]|uniref:Uncharacterized protein n=1 Tax=Rhizobium lusitanum TaxID=293958 RepID=A0A7X0IX13_9HYPH|nr:hypothetical protein [Rhizobium lusitanum]